MASYLPPNSFTTGDPIDATELQENRDELKRYLHNIESSALRTSTSWVNTQHIAPPRISPIDGVFTAVSGVTAGQTYASGDAFSDVTFASSYITGLHLETQRWHVLPNSSVQFIAPQSGTAIFHWWAQLWTGPDDATYRAAWTLPVGRHVWVSPFHQTTLDGKASIASLQAVNAPDWSGAGEAKGADYPYPMLGSAHLSGRMLVESTLAGRQTFGLAVHSEIARVVVVSFGWSLETWHI